VIQPLDPSHRAAVVRRELFAAPEPWEAIEWLRQGANPWLLDSALRSDRLGRHSFAGADPWAVLRLWGDRLELDCVRAVHPGWSRGSTELRADPFEVARACLPRVPPDIVPGGLPFVGGAIAVLGYELAEHVESLDLRGLDDLGLPDLTLLFIDRLLVWDHLEGRAWAVGLGFGANESAARAAAGQAAAGIEARLSGPPVAEVERLGPSNLTPRPSEQTEQQTDPQTDPQTYWKVIDQVKHEIAAGHVYQACLTRREVADCPADPWLLYCALRRVNPAPFACYLELPDSTVVGSSPERFLRLDLDRNVESRPIKGTRPRGENATEDALLRSELAASVKDRAENLMIVDLVRNDLGRVCEMGSIEVPELMAIEAYESVFQMVSTVTGRLRPECDVFDLLRATFPPGSMTGAPKIAAMQLLGGLEPVRRGIYSGAIGYLDVRGSADLSVVIRTLIVRDGRAYLHSGGGIVSDSDPALEWAETVDKIRPLFTALAQSVEPPERKARPSRRPV